MTTLPGWHSYFIGIAHAVSARADCTRRRVGAVLVDRDNDLVSVGTNGAPKGEPGCLTAGACPRGQLSYEEVKEFTSYTEGPGKCIAVHAEIDAVNKAQKRGIDVNGMLMYITCAPCQWCAKSLADLGIRPIWME